MTRAPAPRRFGCRRRHSRRGPRPSAGRSVFPCLRVRASRPRSLGRVRDPVLVGGPGFSVVGVRSVRRPERVGRIPRKAFDGAPQAVHQPEERRRSHARVPLRRRTVVLRLSAAALRLCMSRCISSPGRSRHRAGNSRRARSSGTPSRWTRLNCPSDGSTPATSASGARKCWQNWR